MPEADLTLERFAVPVISAGPEGQVLELNTLAHTLLGDAVGRSLSEVVTGEGVPPRLERLAELPDRTWYRVERQPAELSRYREWLRQSREAVFRFDLEPPVETALPADGQTAQILQRARLVECSEALARVRGAPATSELAGCGLEDFFALTEGRASHWVERFVGCRYLLADGEMRGAGGAVLAAEWIGVVETGKLTSIWGSLRDITAQRRMEAELMATEQRYRKLFESTSDILFTADETGRIVSGNAALERITGGGTPRLVSLVVVEHRDKAARLLAGAREGRTVSAEIDVAAANRRRLSLEISLSPLAGSGTAPVFLGIARDVTGQRASERFETGRRAVLEMLALDVPLEVVLDRLTGIVEMYVPRAMAAVSRMESGRLSYVAGRLPEAFREQFQGTPVGPMAASCGTAAFLERPVVASRIETDPTWVQLGTAATAAGLAACWSAPLMSASGKVLGTLALYFPEPAESDHELMQLLESAARLASLTIEHRTLTDKLRYQATHDAVTGLPNRYALEARLREALEPGAAQPCFAVLYIDLDRFKLVNDSYGHGTGDEFLQRVAVRISGCLRTGDMLARVGGDEFIALLMDPAHGGDARPVLATIHAELQRPLIALGRELFVSTSIGVSLYPEHGDTPEALIGNADAALSQAKNEGRNTYRFFAPRLLAETARRLEMQNELHRALDRSEFSLCYQPQYDLRTGRLLGEEALIRWQSSMRGQVGPDEFIPVAEESGLIIPIGRWVLRQACRHGIDVRQWGGDPVRVAVNVSAVQLALADFVEQVAEVLRETGLPPALLELEITETALLRDPGRCAENLIRLRQLGVAISVDDFGTGYSSLSRLQQIPLDSLKIDRSFVREIRDVLAVPPIVQAIVALGRGLGIHVTAEGVENQHQLRVLRDLGCHGAQGFLLGRPVPAGQRQPVFPGYDPPNTLVRA